MNKTPFDQVIENLTLDRNFKTLRLDSFLNEMAPSGHLILRNIYQLFHDMIHFYAQEVKKELVFDAETIGFLNYNLDRIFICFRAAQCKECFFQITRCDLGEFLA